MANPRQTAFMCRVADILRGEYVIQEGWEPNYVKTAQGKVSRASVIGVVVGIDDPLTFFLDDSTGRVMVRAFEGALGNNCTFGQIVHVIGRPRFYNNEMFIVPEIVKETSAEWAEYRKCQLGPAVQAAKPEEETMPAENTTPDDIIIQKISSLDKGEGACIDELIAEIKLNNAEARVNKLIEEGVIFANRPGRVKVL